MNSLADGAHASPLQKSYSHAICSFCPVAVPNVAEANSNHCPLSQLQNEALEESDIVSVC